MSHVAKAETPRMTLEEFQAEGARLFGPDPSLWIFQCPICKGTQNGRQMKEAGGDPNNVYYSCIGRYLPAAQKAFGGKPTPETHCDYTLGGLFRMPGLIVMHDGKERYSFAFADLSPVTAEGAVK